MFETLDKLLLAGLGAVSMTRERAEKLFDDYVAQGKTAKEHRSGFVKDLVDQAEKTRHDLETLVEKQVREVITRMHLATQDDLARVEAKIDELLRQRI